MSDNPYQSPEASSSPARAVGVRSGSREDVRAVALYQKGIVVCILAYLVCLGLALAGFAILQNVVPWVALVAVLVGAVLVVLLAIRVYGVGLGIVLGLLTLVPLLGLLILLMVNGKATRVLRDNGARVGLFGADLSTI